MINSADVVTPARYATVCLCLCRLARARGLSFVVVNCTARQVHLGDGRKSGRTAFFTHDIRRSEGVEDHERAPLELLISEVEV